MPHAHSLHISMRHINPKAEREREKIPTVNEDAHASTIHVRSKKPLEHMPIEMLEMTNALLGVLL